MAAPPTALRYAADAFPLAEEIEKTLEMELLENEDHHVYAGFLTQQEEDDLYDAAFGSSPLSSVESSPAHTTIDLEGTSLSPPYAFPPERTIYAYLNSSAAGESVQSVDEDRHQNGKKKRNKLKSKENRRQKRQAQPPRGSNTPYFVREATLRKHVDGAPKCTAAFQIQDMPIARSSYVGVRGVGGRVYGMAEAVAEEPGFTLVKWDGRVSMPLLAGEYIVAVLVGRPSDGSWDEVHNGAFESMRAARSRCQLSTKNLSHRRGDYPALSTGISHGGGQTKPGNLVHTEPNASVLQELVNDPNISRIVGFTNGAFATWSPKLYRYYDEQLNALLAHDPALKRNHEGSVWGAMCFNLGPKTVTKVHTDNGNYSTGVCAVTPVGRFDPTRGGHLVLWTLKLIIEFPAGSTILLPSATIPHSNIPIHESEERCSLTEFSAGGLFRWVENGFKPVAAQKNWRRDMADKRLIEERKQKALSLLSTLEDLHLGKGQA